MTRLKSLIDLGYFFSAHPLTRDAPLKAWARFLRWQFRSCVQGEVIVPWIGGQSLALRRGMRGATGNIYFGLHEFPDMMMVLHFLREGDRFVDIGANVGSYTVLASGVARATSWAFEPDPNTARYLRRNVAINHLERLVTVYECALGATQGEVPFTVGLDAINRVANAADDENVRMVRHERLDTIAGNSQPSMIKIDVEGYEEEVLRGAPKVLANPSLKVVELETVTTVIEHLLLRNQFERAYYDPFNRKLNRQPAGPRSSNFLYVKDWPLVSRRLADAREIKVLNHSI
jgi:FkbM family methyltransferase